MTTPSNITALQLIPVSELLPVLEELAKEKGRQAEFPPVMTIKQVAAYLQVTEQTVRNKIKQENLPVTGRCGDPRFIRSDIDAWLRGQI